MFSSIICIDNIDEFTICISNDYTIYSFGKREYNTNTPAEETNIPKQINNLINIKMIDCGFKHVISLNFNGDIFSFGKNDIGQLGIGKDNNELEQTHIPQKINIPPCKQVSCGDYFTICLTEDHILYSFGNNTYGQLGLGNNSNYNSPQLIPDFNNIEFIASGGKHTICKTYSTKYYSWGSNDNGQLGQDNYNNQTNKPIQCLNWSDNIISIKCGESHSLLLTSEGQVYSFGTYHYGRIRILNNSINSPILLEDIPEIQRIECGYNHSLCIDFNNNLWLFGSNEYGQLGLGDKEHKYKPIIHPTLSNIIDISSRGNHTFVKTSDNKIYAFGNNKYSQLGIKTSKYNQVTPIQVFIGKEEIWCSTIGKYRTKSARK